ncbi:MAG: DUF4112 domain-containing protein, partial [Pseudomonadota bacterium]
MQDTAQPNSQTGQAASEQGPLPSDTGVQAASPAPNIETSRYIARMLDMSIPVPGTKFHLGADSIVGLVPVLGDVVTGAAGCVILAEAARHKVPPEIMGKMVVNLGVDVAGGAIMPGIGDLFDVFWKANKMNLTLMEDHLGLERTFKKGGEETKDTEALKLNRNPAAASSQSAETMAKSSILGGLAERLSNSNNQNGTQIDVLQSAINPKLEWVKYTFKVENMGRRTDTKVWGGGGGGQIHTIGGQVSGGMAPVQINSKTTHKSELWFTNEDGQEEWVTINMDAIMVRDGQTMSVLYTRRKGERETFIAARNQSTGSTQDMSSDDAFRKADNCLPTVFTWIIAAIVGLVAL